MGLRELKAERTRRRILETGVALFLEKGYDATSIDEIAERAEVGKSTLYRYFPGKEEILLDPFLSRVGALAEDVRASPPELPLQEVLGQVVVSYAEAVPAGEEDFTRLRQLIDATPSARARLWDVIAQEQLLLEVAVAERTARPADDLAVMLESRITLVLAQLVAERVLADGGRRPAREIALELLESAGSVPLAMPAATTRSAR